MNSKELTTFITKFKKTDDFTGGVDKAQITFVQNELEVNIPESYKWFLSNYGSGGMFGVDIQGVGNSTRPPVIVHTKRFRDLGMEENLVVIENAGEYAYCLYTSKTENGECPVIAWNRVGGLDDYYTAKNFYEFLSQRLLDAKEAWDEDF